MSVITVGKLRTALNLFLTEFLKVLSLGPFLIWKRLRNLAGVRIITQSMLR
jgi:hypothetical protein